MMLTAIKGTKTEYIIDENRRRTRMMVEEMPIAGYTCFERRREKRALASGRADGDRGKNI